MAMKASTGSAVEWVFPLAFILVAGFVIWDGPRYILAFGWGSEALAQLHPTADMIHLLALLALPILFVLGTLTVRRAAMEHDQTRGFDRVSIFLGRVTMLLIALIVGVMFTEVVLRYVFERPTLWANELSLWMAGFVFMFAGLYAMQQRSHIRIFLIYDLFPRWLQKLADTFSTVLIVLFAAAMVYGGFGEAQAKFLRWETFGTAFDPPLPATLKPAILVIVVLVAVQAVSNLIFDWNRAKEKHAVVDDVDVDEIAQSVLADQPKSRD